MGKYYKKTVKPSITANAATAFATADLLFDWFAFDIPRGAARIRSFTSTVAGTNGTKQTPPNIDLIFAKDLNGVAPATLGTPNLKLANGTLTKSITTSVKNHIIGYGEIVQTNVTTGGFFGPSYDIFTQATASTAAGGDILDNIILEGEVNPNNKGSQRIYIAAVTKGAIEFGTDIQLNQAGNQAAATSPTQITIEQGADTAGVATHSFAVGDILRGATGGPTMEVVSFDSATLMTVKNISEQIDNNEELILDAPIVFHFGFEY
tara:strand:- start:782 stop:1573 length:792 start_codon:yes stop_codon:yes gene_type:complete